MKTRYKSIKSGKNIDDMKNNQKSTSYISKLTHDILIVILRIIIKSLLWIAKHFWKRYFGIETPVYKLWWKTHATAMQKKLDMVHQSN